MRLRPYKSCDAKKIISWIRDEEVFHKWGGDHFGEYPISAEIVDNKYLNDNGDCNEEDNFYPWIAFTDEDGVIGHFIMRYIHGDNKVLRFGWVIVDDSIRGKGYGTSMLRTGLNYAFNILGVHTVTIGVFEHNDIAHSCYKKVGFVDKEIVPHERDNIILMAKQKVRATRHNGRKGENGVFKAGHNDRSFDVDAAEHIDPSRSLMNVYWDMYQGYNIAGTDGVRPERRFSFEEIEKAFYCSQFGDSLDAQTERHIKSRHKDRIRTMDQIREDSKTCPEETVYQLGTKDGHEDPALFVQVVAELVEEFTKRFGSHVQVLDWALHMDEATPHIHERHVFFADDGYGMNFPKQEKACEALGFERPNPEKKSNKFNNAKMVFDEEVRKLYIEIAEKYGVVIEKIPLEGKKHLEKNVFILAKQAEEIANNEARLQSLELKIEDVETFSEEVAKVAYEKACEVVAEEVRAMTIEEDVGIVEAYKGRIESDKAGIKKENKPFAIKLLDHVVELLKRGKVSAISKKIEKALGDPASKKKNTDEIAGIAKASVLAKLKEQKAQVELADQQREQTPAKKKEECL